MSTIAEVLRCLGGTGIASDRGNMHHTPICDREQFEDWLDLIRSEYAEMPGLHLSRRQAERLWGLDSECCQALFERLESTRYLKRSATDAYVRANLGS